ncbi:hypothetical protein Aduo_005515 [Ancylostoma duodenale]
MDWLNEPHEFDVYVDIDLRMIEVNNPNVTIKDMEEKFARPRNGLQRGDDERSMRKSRGRLGVSVEKITRSKGEDEVTEEVQVHSDESDHGPPEKSRREEAEERRQRIQDFQGYVSRTEAELAGSFRKLDETSIEVEQWIVCAFCHSIAMHYSDSCPYVTHSRREL